MSQCRHPLLADFLFVSNFLFPTFSFTYILNFSDTCLSLSAFALLLNETCSSNRRIHQKLKKWLLASGPLNVHQFKPALAVLPQMSGVCPLRKEAGKSHCSCWCGCQPLAWAVSWKTVIRLTIGAPLLSRAHHVDVFACGGGKKRKGEKKKSLCFWRRGWHCSATAAAISAADSLARQCRSDSLLCSAHDKAWISHISPLPHR